MADGVLSAEPDVVEELASFDVLHEHVYCVGSLDQLVGHYDIRVANVLHD